MQLLHGIGLGTFPLANVFTKISKSEAKKIVHTLLDLEGKYIQTAPYYKGVYEILKEILQEIPRDKYYLSTSCVKNRQGICEWKYESIIEQTEDSLKALEIEHIDLLMTSDPNTDDLLAGTPFEETMRAMQDLQKQGKIRDIGVANVTPDELKAYNQTGSVQYVQNRFSLLNRTVDARFSSYLSEHGIGFIPYETLERGMLTDKGMHVFELGPDDFRRRKPEFSDEVRQLISHWVIEHLHPIAESLRTSIEALVLWWVLQQPYIALCVVGATKSEQVISNLGALNVRPESDTLDRIENAYRALESQIDNVYPTTIQKFMRVRYRI